MADIKFTSLTLYNEDLSIEDKFPIVDISDNSMGATGTNKIIGADRVSRSVALLMPDNILNGSKLVDNSLSSNKLSAGSPTWSVNSNINVGYATSNADLTLNIGQNRTPEGKTSIRIFSNNGLNPTSSIVKDSGDNSNLVISNAGSGGIEFKQLGAGNISLSTDNTERIRILSDGKIGIGTSSPSVALQVVGTISAGNLTAATTLTATNIAVTGSNIVFEGSSADDFETTLTVANPTADNTITLPNATGTVVLSGAIGNSDISSSAAIADTKLATISTSGKVSNSATTATSTNTDNTIVLRGSGGNFSAGTITASSFIGTVIANENSTAPTAPINTSTTQIATTQFVQDQLNAMLFASKKGQDIILDNHTIEDVTDLFHFNYNVAISENGNRIAICSKKYGIKIYDYINNQWSNTGNLTHPNVVNSGLYYSLAMNKSGTTIAFNVLTATYTYHAVVYNFSGGSWTQLGNTINLTYDLGQPLSMPICIDNGGTRIAVGEKYSEASKQNCGRVRIYNLTNNTWSNSINIIGDHENAEIERRSFDMSGSGNRISIPSREFNNLRYIKVYDAATGNTIGQTDLAFNTGATIADIGGTSLNEDGSVLAVSDYSSSNPTQYKVKVYKYDGSSWNPYGVNGGIYLRSYNEKISLNSSGNTIVVANTFSIGLGYGLPQSDTRGTIKVFKLIGDAWYKLGIDATYGSHVAEILGQSIAMNADGTHFIAFGVDKTNPNSTLKSVTKVYDIRSLLSTLSYQGGIY